MEYNTEENRINEVKNIIESEIQALRDGSEAAEIDEDGLIEHLTRGLSDVEKIEFEERKRSALESANFESKSLERSIVKYHTKQVEVDKKTERLKNDILRVKTQIESLTEKTAQKEELLGEFKSNESRRVSKLELALFSKTQALEQAQERQTALKRQIKDLEQHLSSPRKEKKENTDRQTEETALPLENHLKQAESLKELIKNYSTPDLSEEFNLFQESKKSLQYENLKLSDQLASGRTDTRLSGELSSLQAASLNLSLKLSQTEAKLAARKETNTILAKLLKLKQEELRLLQSYATSRETKDKEALQSLKLRERDLLNRIEN